MTETIFMRCKTYLLRLIIRSKFAQFASFYMKWTFGSGVSLSARCYLNITQIVGLSGLGYMRVIPLKIGLVFTGLMSAQLSVESAFGRYTLLLGLQTNFSFKIFAQCYISVNAPNLIWSAL
ncbi:hypothetical protein N7492_007496 [Penicillium capsulatum]|uniref:Uncharacterized protein n=1 Tax=Penicillium capsulatum TaxID=69766 RepID=A0A9W9HZX9_9EURO|nr:hypothetical protein N7492_007496 [Penicillium capsulatum]